MNITIAQKVKQTIEKNCPSCFSLYAGYGLKNGEYVQWPSGVLLKEKRDENGRCLSANYVYADGSKIKYVRRSKSDGYVLLANEVVE